MSFNLPPDPDQPHASAAAVSSPPRGRALLFTLIALGVVVVGFWVFAGFYTDLLWFRSIGFSSVYTTELKTRVLLFVLFGLAMAAVVGGNVWVAYHFRPVFRGLSMEQQSLDRYRVSLDPYRRGLTIAGSTVLGLLAGGSAASEWQTFLLWRNSKAFGSNDAQFGVDLSFFAFRLPFWRFLVGFGFAMIVVSLLASLVTHYLYGGLRLQTPGEKTTAAARTHIAILLGLFVLLKAAAYWFDRYALVVKGSSSDRYSGATYADVNALLPAKLTLFIIAIICALLFFATIVTRNWLTPAIGFGLLVLSAVVVGGIYPAFVQTVQVNPSEADKEAPYIARNIDATIKAYGLDGVKTQAYVPKTDPKAAVLSADATTVNNIRLMDPAILSPTFQQLQQNKGYYGFVDTLDVDRYQLAQPAKTTVPVPAGATESQLREAIVAVRELNLDGLDPKQRNFTNDHTVYTHGFGLVGAYGNVSVDGGKPDFFETDSPASGPLQITQPRIYFGEQSPDYSIVGAPAGAQSVEFDYPSSTAASSIDNQSTFTYDGKGGVSIGTPFNRALFAVKFGDTNLLLSDRINSASKILWNRDPRDRIQAVAPWLTLDGDAYPAAVDGRIVWIVDGYTTSDGYPYSKRTTLGDATTDSLTASSSSVVAQAPDEVNYIRNSVKAVVDAYDGTVNLYEWDKTDPVLKVWRSAFPGTVKDYSEIPADLMPHLRYPQDLFKVQRDLYAKYHVTDPKAFYSSQDLWTVPTDPTKSAGLEDKPQPPYYLTLAMPGQDSAVFSLTTTFGPNNRDTLAAFMAVDSQPGPDYGTIRVLQLPRDTTVPGPRQMQANFESTPEIAQLLTLLRQRGSDVVYGNLLSLPVGGGLLYVEPVYLRATSSPSYPLLQKVLVSYGSGIAIGDNLNDALAKVFTSSPVVTPPPTGTQNPPVGTTALDKALAAAQQALKDSDAALKAGDFAAYGVAQKQLATAIADAAAAATALSGTRPTASPSASPTASGTSS